MTDRERAAAIHQPVAVVGLGCVFPGARGVAAFWDGLIEGRSGISAVPDERWDVETFYDPDPSAPDRTYCRSGGFIRDWQFDSRAFRIPPAAAQVMDRAQQYALVAAREALSDAGLDRRQFSRASTAVIFGVAAGRLEQEERTAQRVQLALLERLLHTECDRRGLDAERRDALLTAFRDEYLRGLEEITEDTFAGGIPNVIAGRVASAFDLHGPNYVVDAACASSLAAVDCAVDSLRHGDADLVVCGGAHAHMGLSLFIGLAKSHGLSQGRMSPFDASADGLLIGEGAGVFVLKRLDDALRDRDRVYAVIRGIGSSSDGREKGVGAPNPKAQALAMRRAMDAAGYSPGTVQFVEAHAAATSVGDPAEIAAMHEVFAPHLAPGQRIAISAVKSQIGHLMGGAGAAGLMKTVLGLHHRVLPPMINFSRPHPAISWDTLPFDVVTGPRPWPDNRDGLPRRANVSGFGFGGNNFHVALEAFDDRWHRPSTTPSLPPPREPIAIVGVAGCLPASPDVGAFWDTLVARRSAVGEVPPDQWDGDASLFVSSDPGAPDKCLAGLGAFAATPAFDGRRLRITPATLAQIDPSHRRLLAGAAIAFDEAPALASAELRQRTAVIVGEACGSRQLYWSLIGRISARRAEMALRRAAGAVEGTLSVEDAGAVAARLAHDFTANRLPVTEDTAYAVSSSLGAARVTKGLDLMGTHMAVDAACASSLAAVTVAVRGLQAGKWDCVLTGGVAGGLTPDLAVVASKVGAHSATAIRPFEADADGFIVGEGTVVFALRRLSDAIRDGDRIHGVIRAIGASSNGRGHEMYSPAPGQQALAISRAYADCGLPPSTVQYVECHATATPTGDASELQALQQVFGSRTEGSLALGAVKGQIGHTLAAAGAAGLLKVLLGLERKTLPPMPPVARPNPAITGAFRLITAPEPWTAPADGEPRRGAVNAFGFGGTNWHLVVEEFSPAYHRALVSATRPAAGTAVSPPPGSTPPLAAAVFVAAGGTAPAMREAVGRLAYDGRRREGDGPWRLAFVADSAAELKAKVDLVAKHYRPGVRSPLLEAQGVYATNGDAPDALGLIAGLFPGQGAQYADMLRDLSGEYEVVRRTIDEADQVLREALGTTFAEMLFTPSRSADDRAALEQMLTTRSDIAQPCLVTAGVALHRLAVAHGVHYATVTGHSLGEYSALVAAGMLGFEDAVRVAHARGQAFRAAAAAGEGGLMAMVGAPAERLASVLESVPGYAAVANRNCPSQTVLSGEPDAVRAAVARCEADGLECRILPIDGASHSRVAAGIRRRMVPVIASLQVRPPEIRVLSSVDLSYYEPGSDCSDRVRRNLVEQLITPVDFIGVVERLYADGHRVFVEPGPKHALTGFVDDILGDTRPHRALFQNHPKFGEVPQFRRFLAQTALLEQGPQSCGSGADRESPPVVAAAGRTDPSVRRDGERVWITGISAGSSRRRDSADDLTVAMAGADSATLLAVVAGLECLRDGQVPLQRVAAGSLEGSWQLPATLQRETGVVLGSAFGGHAAMLRVVERELALKYGALAATAIRGRYLDRLQAAGTEEERLEADRWFEGEHRALKLDGFRPAGRGIPNPVEMTDSAHVRFARLVHARGPSVAVSAAGASTAAALATAEDMIRRGRARRVVVIVVDDSGSSLLAQPMGVLAPVEPAAAGFVLEAEDAARDRGVEPLAELLGVRVVTRPSLQGRAADTLEEVVAAFLDDMCAQHGLEPHTLAPNLVCGAEAFSAPTGRLDEGEARGLRRLFGDRARDVLIVDTGQYAGQARGAGLQDGIWLEALHAGRVPLSVRRGGVEAARNDRAGDLTTREYALGVSAGDGSQIGLWLTHVVSRGAERESSDGNDRAWSEAATGVPRPSVSVVDRILEVDEAGLVPRPGPAPPAPGPTPPPDSSPQLVATSSPPRVVESTAGSRQAHAIAERVLAIVEEKTGYERELLELDLDLEADLGIDTIKQAQVMARLRDEFDLPKQQTLGVKDFPTLRHVVQFINAHVEGGERRDGSGAAAHDETPIPGAAVTAAKTQSAVPQPIVEAGAPARHASADAVADEVLGIIETITGYEREALDPELDLEADLGIDTIKQAQVMARLRDRFNLPREQGVRIKDFPTIRHILEYIASRPAGSPASLPAATPAPAPPLSAGDPGATAELSPRTFARASLPAIPSGIVRMAVRWAPLPIEREEANRPVDSDWTVLITDDGLGVAQALARRLSAAGARVELLRHDGDVIPVRQRLGRISALVLLHALATDPSVAALDASAWRDVLQRKVVTSFRTIQALRTDLEVVVAATGMAGPCGWRGQLVDPAAAGVAGLLKSLRQEAAGLLVKVVDAEHPATAAEADQLAGAILAEVQRGGARVEVAYRDGVRLVPRVFHEPLDLSGPGRQPFTRESVVLAIGGSRGITGTIVRDLAARYQPRLELVGSRALPPNVEALASLDRDGLAHLRETIARGWKARLTGVRIKPLEIERQYREALRAIEAFRTIRACEAAGASVRYHVCDVRDGVRLGKLVKILAQPRGHLDGVIFGAGSIEDKLIEDKTIESFDRVFGIKAEGMFNLYKALDGVTVSVLAAFTSVAGRFGNAGQADYSAANEVTARFASLMQAARPASRVVAVDWTAWDEVGLAARSGVVDLMKDRGFAALAPAEGARFFQEELRHGTGPEEVVIASADLPIDRDRHISPGDSVPGGAALQAPRGVFLQAVERHARGAWLAATATLDPRTDTWLRDHMVEGVPLMPAVFAIEMMSEAAAVLFPDLHVCAVADLRLHLGVKVLRDRPIILTVTAVAGLGAAGDERTVRVRVTSDVVAPDGRVLVAERLHYTCQVHLRSTAPVAEGFEPRVRPSVDPAIAIPPLYGPGGTLPHGPSFQVVDHIDALDGQGVVATLAEPDVRRVLPFLNGGRLRTLPFAREGAFQAAGLWAILRHGHIGLPHGCRLMRTFGAPPEGTTLVAHVAPRTVDSARIEFDIDVVGPDGRVYDRMEAYYTVNPFEAAARAAANAESEAAP